MFGSYLGRAVRSAPSTALPTRPTASSSSLGVAASSAAAAAAVVAGAGVVRPLTSTRSCGGQKHQRCHSSSKTSSCPPEGPKSETSTEQAGTTATTTTTTTTAAAAATTSGASSSPSSASKKGIGRSNGDGDKRPGGRSGGRKKPRDVQQQVVIKGGRDSSVSSLPIVPSTQHVEPTHITLSSFFSQHRPISLTSAVPDSSSEASFDAIFDPGYQNSSRKPADVIHTLSQTIESFEEASEVKAEKDFRWNLLQNAPPPLAAASEDAVTHLDGAPKQISLEQLITQFRPFNAPPAPVAHKRRDNSKRAQKHEPDRQGQQMLEQGMSKPKRRIWSTTLIVSESTFPDGTTSYAVATTPVSRMSESRDKAKSKTTSLSPSPAIASKRGKRGTKVGVAVARPALDNGKIREPASGKYPDVTQRRRPIRQPFLQRMLLKQWRWEQYWQERNERRMIREGEAVENKGGVGLEENKMVLLSVKRQRKLKMKKHKYKKLMKRQRNLRRRLDRN